MIAIRNNKYSLLAEMDEDDPKDSADVTLQTDDDDLWESSKESFREIGSKLGAISNEVCEVKKVTKNLSGALEALKEEIMIQEEVGNTDDNVGYEDPIDEIDTILMNVEELCEFVLDGGLDNEELEGWVMMAMSIINTLCENQNHTPSTLS